MLLGLEAERVHVDTLLGNVLVVLVGLHQVEIATIALGEAVVAVELQLGKLHGVDTVLEGDGDEDGVGTTSGHTGHGAGITGVGSGGGGDQVGEGSREGAADALGGGGRVPVVEVVGVVEPLLALGSAIRDVLVGLHDPNELLAWVVEVQLDLVLLLAGGLVASELQLLDQVLVRDLGEAAALVGIQIDVVDEQRAAVHGDGGHSAGVGGPVGAVGGGGGPDTVPPVTELKVNLDLMIL